MIIDQEEKYIISEELQAIQQLLMEKKFEDALESVLELVKSNQRDPVVLGAVGNVYFYCGDYNNAVKWYEKSLGVSPRYIDSLFNMAASYKVMGHELKAVNTYEKVIKFYPDDFDSFIQLGKLFYEKGEVTLKEEHFKKSMDYFKKALEINKHLFDPWFYNGHIFFRANEMEKAVWAYNNACQENPDHPEAYNRLAVALQACLRLDNAEQALKFALENTPGWETAIHNLATCLFQQAKLKQSYLASESILKEIQPDNPDRIQTHSFYVFSKIAVDTDWKENSERYNEWGNHYADRYMPEDPPVKRKVNDKIRVGYVSSDFMRHSAAMSFMTLFENYDREKFHVTAYNSGTKYDDFTRKFEQLSDEFRQVHMATDEELVEIIKGDNPDILIDLNGQTTGNRLLVFARKPAPIQITGLGFNRTTGLKAMDYIFTDTNMHPQEVCQYIHEKPLYLDTFIHWDQPSFAIHKRISPVLDKGFLTFGCFNSLFKFSEYTFNLFTDILKSYPESELILKTKVLSDKYLRINVRNRFKELGVDPKRIKLFGQTSFKEHLLHYNQVDVCLDPFPYQGGITTCESLWMGKPVIVMDSGGITRSSISILKTVFGGDANMYLANSHGEYIQKAIGMKDSISKSSVNYFKDKITSSKICDPVAYSNQIYNYYEQLIKGEII